MIKQTILEIIALHSGTPIEQIKNSTSLQEDLMLDNVKFNDIIESIERHFNLSIPVHELDTLYSVYDIVHYIKVHYKP